MIMEASSPDSSDQASSKRNKLDEEAVKPGENGDGEAQPSFAGVVEEEQPMSIVLPDSSEYFASYEDLNVHRLMLQDTVRTNAYQEAIMNASSLFKDKIIMDVGAGTGILSLFCAKAGAKKVYAVEASNLAKVISEVAAKNEFANVINVVHSRVENIKELKEGKVDIIVSEWMGFYLLHESMLDSVLYARDHFLCDGGHMFPNTAQIYAAPCSTPEIWKENIGFWSSEESHYGFDLSPFQNIARNIMKPLVEIVPTEGLMSDPQLLFDLNLQTIQPSTLQTFKDRRFFSIEKTDAMHSVCVWFTCTFPVVPDEEPVELSTAPWKEPTHWKQTVILLPDKVEFEEGDITGWDITFEKSSEKDSRSYTIEYQCLDPEDEHPVPCDCGTVKCEIIKQFLGQSQENQAVDDE